MILSQFATANIPYTLQFSFLIALHQILRERGCGEEAFLNEFPFGCLWDNGEL
jgi:hypothetical protein